LKGTLGTVREFLNALTRNSKQRGNWTGKTIIHNEEGDSMIVPLHILPKYLFLPVFDYLPRKLLREQKKNKHRKFDVKMIRIHDLQDSVASGWGQRSTINSNPWARFIAKIAYGEYIRQHDLRFRSKFLSEFIVNNYGDPSNFVGGRNSPPSINAMYEVNFYALKQKNKQYAMVGYLRIFATFETPSYLVHLGEVPLSELPQKIHIKSEWSKDDLWLCYQQDEIIEGGPLTGSLVD